MREERRVGRREGCVAARELRVSRMRRFPEDGVSACDSLAEKCYGYVL
jgi:hypothetical protein